MLHKARQLLLFVVIFGFLRDEVTSQVLPCLTKTNYSSFCMAQVQHLKEDKYSRTLMPLATPDSSKVINVGVMFAISLVDQIDSLAETISYAVQLRFKWTSPRFGELYKLYAPCDQKIKIDKISTFWYPAFVVQNAASDINYGALKEVAAITHDTNSEIWWQILTYLTTSCRFKVYWFPYDVQDCEFVLVNPLYRQAPRDLSKLDPNVTYLNYTLDDDQGVNFGFYWGDKTASLPLWRFTKGCIYTDFSSQLPNRHFRFRIERKPYYYWINIGLPIILTSILMAFTFIIAPGNGEKVTYALTILLAFLVLLFSVADLMPADSRDIPLLTIFMVILLLTSTAATLASTIVRKMAMNSETRQQANRLNKACLIGYCVLTVVEYLTVILIFVVKKDSYQKDQELRGGCTYNGPYCEDVYFSIRNMLSGLFNDDVHSMTTMYQKKCDANSLSTY